MDHIRLEIEEIQGGEEHRANGETKKGGRAAMTEGRQYREAEGNEVSDSPERGERDGVLLGGGGGVTYRWLRGPR